MPYLTASALWRIKVGIWGASGHAWLYGTTLFVPALTEVPLQRLCFVPGVRNGQVPEQNTIEHKSINNQLRLELLLCRHLRRRGPSLCTATVLFAKFWSAMTRDDRQGVDLWRGVVNGIHTPHPKITFPTKMTTKQRRKLCRVAPTNYDGNRFRCGGGGPCRKWSVMKMCSLTPIIQPERIWFQARRAISARGIDVVACGPVRSFVGAAP
jgi:hypothetical protein